MSRTLILGSFPGELSIARGQYYAHPRNQFWEIMAHICGCRVPDTYAGKERMILKNGFALWDVVAACEREGSIDASIRRAAVHDLPKMIKTHPGIERVFLNGQTAFRLYKKHFHATGVTFNALPSSSPAHARPLSWKIRRWKSIMKNDKNQGFD